MEIMMCGKKGRCCPSVEKIDDTIVIKDDYQGSVKFTAEQWAILKEKIELGVI